jgi:hypothetical protein
MESKFNINDTVLVEGTVIKIESEAKDRVQYKVRVTGSAKSYDITVDETLVTSSDEITEGLVPSEGGESADDNSGTEIADNAKSAS